MYGIHPHQSQYLVDYSSSIMFNGGHPHPSQYLVGYSSSVMFNGAHPSMLTDGKGILPHQSQTQVDYSSSFMLRDGNGSKSHVETKQIFSVFSLFHPILFHQPVSIRSTPR
jgi:hypothetical protein